MIFGRCKGCGEYTEVDRHIGTAAFDGGKTVEYYLCRPCNASRLRRLAEPHRRAGIEARDRLDGGRESEG